MVAPCRFVDQHLEVPQVVAATASDTMAQQHSVVAVNWTAVKVRTAATRTYEQVREEGGHCSCWF